MLYIRLILSILCNEISCFLLENFKRSFLYRRAVQLLEANNEAVNALGNPLKAKWLDLSDTTNNRLDAANAKVSRTVTWTQFGILFTLPLLFVCL